MPGPRFRNKVSVSPSDVQRNDCFAIKVVAVAGYANDWAAYEGPSDWCDERVAASGTKLSEAQAKPLFYVMARSGRTYRH